MPKKAVRSSKEVRSDMSALASKVYAASIAMGKIALRDGPNTPKLVEIKEVSESLPDFFKKLQEYDLELGESVHAEILATPANERPVQLAFLAESGKPTKEQTATLEAEIERIKNL